MWSYKNSRKKVFVASTFVILILLILLFIKIQSIHIIIISPIPMPEISISPASQVVEKGEEFNINISINPADVPISAAQFNLLFNSSVMNLKKVTEGDFLKQGGAQTTFNSGTMDKKRGVLINVWGLLSHRGQMFLQMEHLHRSRWLLIIQENQGLTSQM